MLICVTSLRDLYAATWQTYEEYTAQAGQFCDDTTKLWWTSNTLVPKIDYPELNAQAVNSAMEKWKSSTELGTNEILRLKTDLDPITIGEYSGFKTLEVARIGYRTRMNSAFTCAVVSSRQKTITELQKIIATKIKTKNYEIVKKLELEWDKLVRESNKLKCHPTENIEMITNLVNTTTRQYCHYRHYLGYLDSSINANLRDIQVIEQKIGKWSGTQIAKTTEEWTQIAPRYPRDLANEILRADTTLPKAIRTFQEMDQTYGAHILLTFIYNDYIELRKSLSNYMNISSQLYQKAHNAQSTNKS